VLKWRGLDLHKKE